VRIPGLAPRFAAWRVLHDVRHGVAFDVALRRAIKDLEPDDKRLAHELAAGVFRRRSTLDATLGGAIDKGLASVRADTLDVLRLGAFQLLHLDRVPQHAAVQTTVGVARRLGGRRIAGFVNAVLRRLGHSAAVAVTDIDTDPDPDTDPDTDGVSDHPAWLVSRWLSRYGAADTQRLLEWNNTRPKLVLQPAGRSIAELEAMLTDGGIGWNRAPFDLGLVVDARRPTELPGFAAGAFFVQDPAQQLVARFLAALPNGLLYDACAAPGGKALALARQGHRVIAADRQRARVRRLAENAARAGQGRVTVIRADLLHAPLRRAGAVLLDVPCLGTGTLARNPDARWRVTLPALTTLAARAARFLAAAAEIVEPGGLLLFATCSLEPEENEEQIARFLAEDRRFRREPAATVPSEVLTDVGDLQVLPQRHGADGAYAARLRKIAG